MRLPVVALFLLVAVFARAAINPEAEPIPFTAKELRQGFRERVILARPKANLRSAAEVAETRDGLRVREKLSRLGDLRIIDLAPEDDAQSAIARLNATGAYEYVEPDYLRHLTVEPNDPNFSNGGLWPLNNNGASNGIAGADIKAAAAWDIQRDAPNVIVAVVDTGVNLTHQDLAGNIWVNPSPTASIGDINGIRILNGVRTGDPTDDNGHGTHVAGTIGAVGNNSAGVTGIAWRVQIMAIKVFPKVGSGTVSDIAAGINYAMAHGAHIINASYGESGSTGYSATELTALSFARQAGIIFVAAAGNSAANMDVTRFYPASHALDNIVSVGASTRRDELATFSNYGAAVDLFAPGSEIVSLDYANNTGTANKSGTSMAAPHVAGALALLKARFPGDDYHQLINRLLRGAEPSLNPNPQTTFANKAQTGGRLNLLRSLNTTTNRPFNDDFDDRPRLSSDNLAIRASNTGATAESGEPAHAGAAANHTLWWQWTAPTSGNVSLDTAGSGYDTTLAVYTGNSPSALALVASNDDNAGSIFSRLTFTSLAGVSYQIAVDSKSSLAQGLTMLSLGTTPANDAFAAAVPLIGESTHVSATNLHCSAEAGEPGIAGFAGSLSLWYRWTAPRSGRFQVSAVSADFDPLLGVYTGGSITTLTEVASNAGTKETGALCTFTATAGTTYSFAIDSRSVLNVGQFTLGITDSLWQSAATDAITGAAAIGSDGTVYVGSTDNTFYAFNPDGSKKWSYTTGGFIDTCSPAIADDGTVYVGSNDGKLYAFTPAGVLRWTHNFGSTAPTSNSPTIGADGTIYVKPNDGFLYALNPSDGSTKWRFDIGGLLTYASSSIGPDGTIYQGSENRQLYAINPDGTQKWTFSTGNDDIYTVPAIDAAGNLYFSVLNTGKLFCVTPAGTLRWVYSGAALGSSSSPALSKDGLTVYYGGYDSKLHAVNTASGTARWVYALGAEVRASSPAVDANGVVYVGCYDYKLYAINFDGTLKRTYDTGNWIRSSPTISGRTLYVGSNDHKLYAFDLGVGAADGPWPQYRQNARRVGRVLPPTNFTVQPASQAVGVGAALTLTTTASDPAATYQWQINGTDIAGATTSSLTVASAQPSNTGLYSANVSTGSIVTPSNPAIVGLTTTNKVIGTGSEVGANIVHPLNQRVYDQILLQGTAATVTADPNQVVRISFVDLSKDIVQVEFSGAGTLSLVLDGSSGPATAENYNQPSVSYMKGHAGIVITGANETTNVSVFSVGKINAVDQTLFKDTVTYDGVADLAYIAILSTNGKFGGLRAANATFFSTKGLTGVYAPGVDFTGPVFVGDIQAENAATPVLRLGSAADVQINGGDLLQPNSRAIQVSGFTQLRFMSGTTSHGGSLPAQTNKGRLEQNGADVTAQVVVNPAP